jgi:hypothetical protein
MMKTFESIARLLERSLSRCLDWLVDNVVNLRLRLFEEKTDVQKNVLIAMMVAAAIAGMVCAEMAARAWVK